MENKITTQATTSTNFKFEVLSHDTRYSIDTAKVVANTTFKVAAIVMAKLLNNANLHTLESNHKYIVREI